MSTPTVLIVLADVRRHIVGGRSWDDRNGGDNLNIITGEWSPHVSAFNSWPGATRNDAYGIGTEILAIALRQCGLAAEFRFRPWKKVLDAADAQAGLAFPFRYSQKRAERFEFSEPLMVSLEYLFFNPIKAREPAHARKIEALTGARLVFVSGYEYAPTFAALRGAEVMEANDEMEFDVILDGPSDFSVAVGTETANGKEGFLIPRGSRALVLSWDDAFTRQQDVGDRHLMYEKTAVKLLDGPLRGRVLWVPNLFLRY